MTFRDNNTKRRWVEIVLKGTIVSQCSLKLQPKEATAELPTLTGI